MCSRTLHSRTKRKCVQGHYTRVQSANVFKDIIFADKGENGFKDITLTDKDANMFKDITLADKDAKFLRTLHLQTWMQMC